MNKATNRKTEKHPLIDCGVLEFVDGKMQRQGRIINLFDQTAMVQTYDWFMGDDSAVALVPLSQIGDHRQDGWLLFANDQARNDWIDIWGKGK